MRIYFFFENELACTFMYKRHVHKNIFTQGLKACYAASHAQNISRIYMTYAGNTVVFHNFLKKLVIFLKYAKLRTSVCTNCGSIQ